MSTMEDRISSALERTSDERMKAMAAQIAATVERILASNEGNKLAIAHQEYADTLKAHGDLDGAIRAYTRSIEVSRPNTALYYLRGIARLENGDDAGAIADFDAGLILEPDNETLKSLRAQALVPRTA
jgi:Flp pilus assembly protein TadD